MGRTRLGLKARLYRGASPTTPCNVVKDQLTLTLTKSEADVTPLGSDWEVFRGTVKAGEISFQLLDKAEDTDVAAFLDSFLNGTVLEIHCLNGPIDEPGASGLRAPMECTQFNRTSANKEGSVYDVTLKITEGEFAPNWFVVARGGGG